MKDLTKRIQRIISILEGVYKTTTNTAQKNRVAKGLRSWQDLASAKQDNERDALIEEKLSYYKDFQPYTILSVIPIKIISGVTDRSLIELHAFFEYLEREYLSLLSQYHLKLDYKASKNRDAFYAEFQQFFHRDFKSYLDLKRGSWSDGDTKKQISQSDLSQKERELILLMGKFLYALFEFLDSLVKDYDSGGNLILNPTELLRFTKEASEEYVLEGSTVIDAVKDFHLFVSELIRYVRPLRV